jgi:cytochrome c oxidase assembly protein subunit 15
MPSPAIAVVRKATVALVALIALTIVSGAFVAGLDAGLTYNTFPLMDGRIVPDGYGDLAPFWLNWTENVAAVQFNHRILAVATVVTALVLAAWSRRLRPGPQARRAIALLAAAALVQLALGIAALLLAVPVWLGAAHQAGAILLLTAALWTLRQLSGRSPVPLRPRRSI